MPPLQYGVNGQFVGDAYMRPVQHGGSRQTPGGVKTPPYNIKRFMFVYYGKYTHQV